MCAITHAYVHLALADRDERDEREPPAADGLQPGPAMRPDQSDEHLLQAVDLRWAYMHMHMSHVHATCACNMCMCMCMCMCMRMFTCNSRGPLASKARCERVRKYSTQFTSKVYVLDTIAA